MKKTVIIAIFLVYLASIVVVQLLGIPTTVPKGEAYIDGIKITGIEFSNPAEGQNTEIRSAVQEDGRTLYAFTYVDGTYTTDEESLKNNPNRIKINYILQPDDAAKEYLVYTVDSNKVYVSEETDELIFLKKVRVELYLKESRANMDVQDSIIIWAR